MFSVNTRGSPIHVTNFGLNEQKIHPKSKCYRHFFLQHWKDRYDLGTAPKMPNKETSTFI